MRTIRLSLWTVVVTLALASVPHAGQNPGAGGLRDYGRLPLRFEANVGQMDSGVRFIASGNGYKLLFTPTEAVLRLERPRSGKAQISQIPGVRAELEMKLIGGNPRPQLTGRDELAGKSNYFIGNDPAKWRTNVTNYAALKYGDVYPGIDLIYYGNQRQLEYDFVVSPGADPRVIRLAIGGTERRRIDASGDLVLGAEGGEIRLHHPVVYQQVDRSRRNIGGNFVIRSGNEVGFELARYDASKPLVIDPVLSYSTYLGASGNEGSGGIAVDSSGNAYLTGTTDSSDFPTANPLQGSFGGGVCATIPYGSVTFPCSVSYVTKLNAAGTGMVYSTYFGGSGIDIGWGIAVDSSGNAYIAGSTTSADFPTANAFKPTIGGGTCRANNDAFWCTSGFVTKLSASGSTIVYSTFLGGSGNDGASGIAVDSAGNAYVTGFTTSVDFPTVNAFEKAIPARSSGFVTKLNAAGSGLVYSTYLGGSGGNDEVTGIAVDSSGNAYVTGTTNSSDFPTANAFQKTFAGGLADAFVTKLNAAGSGLVYSTYLGGSNRGDYGDAGYAIAVDSSGSAYVTGYTDSADFPTSNALQTANHCCDGYEYMGDAFVTKFNPAGSALVYSTHLGGSRYDSGAAIAVDSSGNAYVTGTTYSSDFPVVNGYQSAIGTDQNDAFVTKLSADGTALVYSTFLGGSGEESGTGIAVDSFGSAYVTGFTNSIDFPTSNAFQSAHGKDNCSGLFPQFGIPCADVFVTKLSAASAGPPAPALFSLSGDGTGQGAIWHTDTGQIASPSQPANAGDAMALYATGLVGSGTVPQISIGGKLADILYHGDAPGYPGFSQVNFRVPSGVAPGSAVAVRLSYLGRSSNEVTMGVK